MGKTYDFSNFHLKGYKYDKKYKKLVEVIESYEGKSKSQTEETITE